MPPTRKDYEDALKKQQMLTQRARAVDMAVLHSASVRAEQMTGHPAWDKFLEQLQGRLEQAEHAAADFDLRMKEAVIESDLRIAQINWQVCKSRVDTLREVMELPKLVLETARHEQAAQAVVSGQP